MVYIETVHEVCMSGCVEEMLSKSGRVCGKMRRGRALRGFIDRVLLPEAHSVPSDDQHTAFVSLA